MSVAPLTAAPALAAAPTRIATPGERRAAAALALGGETSALRHLPEADQVGAVASQFEAVLLRQFLQESVGKLMGGDQGGPAGNVYGYLLTDTLAAQIAEGGGLGLGRVLEHQLAPRAPGAVTPAQLHHAS